MGDVRKGANQGCGCVLGVIIAVVLIILAIVFFIIGIPVLFG